MYSRQYSVSHFIFTSNEPKTSSVQDVIENNGNTYRFNVTAVDLDPKPFDRMPFYKEQDYNIVSHYKKMVEEGLVRREIACGQFKE